ncbi:MAG TPA: malate synthase G [Rhodobacteraceae bacterium]|nr:malate synthase G [Paracoccaceae bacterium]
MSGFIEIAGLKVAEELHDFVQGEALAGLDVPDFWGGFAAMVADLTPKNRALLARRAELQAQISAWHMGPTGDYTDFLQEIEYLLPTPAPFSIDTTNVDPEIASIAGPQLVVPITNARFALNAANARWGSLYDALYGTDALGEKPVRGPFDPARGGRVIAWAKSFLDKAVPLAGGSWADVTSLSPQGEMLLINGDTGLADPSQYIGHADGRVILRNKGLHIQILQNPAAPVAALDGAGISDILLESALSSIMDFEDSVACVDAEDKVHAYRNWLGLMKGDLEHAMQKGGKQMVRRLAEDVAYTNTQGLPAQLKGRALMLVRNVGHLMTTPAITLEGEEVFEGLMDAMLTVLCAMHDKGANATQGSIYVVKPKMHGPEEVAFADEIFGRVEDVLGLARHTVKLGIMDEERRTSVNLRACIKAASHRVAFINTGFLDRTGDEIHTSMEAGAMVRKGEMAHAAWIAAYEDNNVDAGLGCGLQGRAQIGKGMWAVPDQMEVMLIKKLAHPQAGANCAWVPSPTAATLHATHYHEVDVLAVQNALQASGPRGGMADLLTIPLATKNWTVTEIMDEIENNAQGILGYVVRWIDQGIGCSTVPDIHNIGLMEDRATCRISSQHLANWLHHGVVGEGDVREAFERMAAVVDQQNAADPLYEAMAPKFTSIAFTTALDLALKGAEQPSGYTEPLLHAGRLAKKLA